MKTFVSLIATAGLAAAAHAGGPNLLTNASFETPDASGGDVPGAPPGWGGFNDPNTQNTSQAITAFDGIQTFKTFGPFDFIGGGTGIFQGVPASPGDLISGEVYAQHITQDALQGDNFAVFKLEFRDAGGNLAAGGLAGVDVFESPPINASSPLDEWILLGTGGVAPANTASVSAVIVQVQLGDGTGAFAGGAVYWDAASVRVVPAPGAAALGMLGLVAMRRRR